jgi:hypothetical protein
LTTRQLTVFSKENTSFLIVVLFCSKPGTKNTAPAPLKARPSLKAAERVREN